MLVRIAVGVSGDTGVAVAGPCRIGVGMLAGILEDILAGVAVYAGGLETAVDVFGGIMAGVAIGVAVAGGTEVGNAVAVADAASTGELLGVAVGAVGDTETANFKARPGSRCHVTPPSVLRYSCPAE